MSPDTGRNNYRPPTSARMSTTTTYLDVLKKRLRIKDDSICIEVLGSRRQQSDPWKSEQIDELSKSQISLKNSRSFSELKTTIAETVTHCWIVQLVELVVRNAEAIVHLSDILVGKRNFSSEINCVLHPVLLHKIRVVTGSGLTPTFDLLSAVQLSFTQVYSFLLISKAFLSMETNICNWKMTK
jgi:hypothetical protein